MTGPALFSDCRRYRYSLERRWSDVGTTANFLMLNPSTADETQDDPTIRRCIGFARAWKHGGLIVTNIFAWRSTDPKQLLRVRDPIGLGNDAHILDAAIRSDVTICAWGAHGNINGRGAKVIDLLHGAGLKPRLFGLTSSGEPKHPLYLKKDSVTRTFMTAAMTGEATA